MKLKSIFSSQNILFLLCFSITASTAYAFTIQKRAEWPYQNDDAIAVDHTTLFHGIGSQIKIFNTSPSPSPSLSLPLPLQKTIQLNTKYNIQAVFADITNKILYVAAGKSGIFIYNYNNLKNITLSANIKNVESDPGFLQGSVRNYINAQALKVEKNYLYVADDAYGFRIFDVSDPANPQYVSGYRQDGKSEDLTTGGYFDLDTFELNSKKYLCILDRFFGLKVFDVTDPEKFNNPNPVKTVSFDIDKDSPPTVPDNIIQPEKDPSPVSGRDIRKAIYNNVSLAQDIKTYQSGSDIFIFISANITTNEKQAVVIKYKFLTNNRTDESEYGFIYEDPENIGRCDENIKEAKSISVNYPSLYAADGEGGLKIIDMETSHGLTEVTDENKKPVNIYKVTKELDFESGYCAKYYNNEIYFADLKNGISQMSESNSAINVNAATGVFFEFTDIAVTGTTPIIAGVDKTTSRFLIFDGKDIAEPVLIKAISSSDNALFVKRFLDGFLLISDKKLFYVNENNSWNTSAEIDLANPDPKSVAVYNNYALISDGSVLDIYSLSAGNFSKITSQNLAGITQLFINEASKQLYTASEKTIRSYDITNIENPVETQSASSSSDIQSLFADQNYIAVSSGKTITLFNTSIEKINEFDIEENISSIFIDQGFLFAGTNSGTAVYTNITSTQPEKLSIHATKGAVKKILLKESKLYSADSTGGISISEYDKSAGSNPAPLPSSGGSSSSCFIKALF